MSGDPEIGILTGKSMRLLERQTIALEKLAKEMEKVARAHQRPMTSKEAAKFLGMTYGSFMAKYKKEIPYVQRNRKLLFEVGDLVEWLRKNKYNPNH